MSSTIAQTTFYIIPVQLSQLAKPRLATQEENLSGEPPKPADSPLPKIEKAIAIIPLKDGTTEELTFEAFDENKFFSRGDYLLTMYDHLRKFCEQNEERIESDKIDLLDPALYVLYQLEVSQLMDDEVVSNLGKLIESLPANNPDKPYLRLILNNILHTSGRLSADKFLKRITNLIETNPDEIIFYEAYAQGCLEINRPDLAVKIFEKFLKRQVRFDDPSAEILVKELIRSDWLVKYGEYLLILSEGAALRDPAKKKLLLVAEKCFLKALEFDTSQTCQRLSYLKLGDINLALASIAKESKEEKEVDKSLEKALFYYEKVLEITPSDFAASLKLATLYAELGEFDKAQEKLEELIKAFPDDPLPYALLGDVRLPQGKFKEALAAYRAAFQKIRIARQNRTIFATQVYQKFVMLGIQARLELANKDIRYSPNFLKRLLRMVGDLLYFMNPFNLGYFAYRRIKDGPPRYTREELVSFVRESKSLEESEIKRFSSYSYDINFYLVNLQRFLELRQNIRAEIEKTKEAMVPGEIIQGLEEVGKQLREKINLNLMRLSVNDEILETDWERALKGGITDELISLLKDSSQNYVSLLSFLSSVEIPEKMKRSLKEISGELWDQEKDRIEEALEYAKEKEDLKVALAVFQIVSMTVEALHEVSRERDEALEKYMVGSLETIIEVAGRKKDYETLLDLARDHERLQDLGWVSLLSARKVAVAEKNAEELKKIAELALSLSRKVEAVSNRQSTAYRALSLLAEEDLLAVYRELLEAYADKPGDDDYARIAENYLEASIQLWRMGRPEKTIQAFQFMLERTKDKIIRALILNDLGYMYLAIDDEEKALEYFKEALKLDPKNPQIAKEIEHIRGDNLLPADMILGSSEHFPRHVLRANVILFSHWIKKPDYAALEQALQDIHEAGGLKIEVKIVQISGRPDISFRDREIKEIRVIKKGKVGVFGDTKEEVILRELRYAGLEKGAIYDERRIEEAIAAAGNRLETYETLDWRVVEEKSELVLEVDIKEQFPFYLRVGGGVGNLNADFFVEGGFRNLWGGGEKLGMAIDYAWFYGGGYKAFSLLEGKIYYKDPHLFVLGDKNSGSLGMSAERYVRRELVTEGKEVVNGGSITFGFNFTPETTLAFRPSFYYIVPDTNPNYFKNGYRISLTQDARNRWLFPSSGYIISGYVEPGLYLGGLKDRGYIETGAEVRKYLSLPLETSLMLKAKGGMGYNLANGDNFFLGDNYVRGNQDLSKFGPAIGAGTAEYRSPVFNIGEYGEYAKIQAFLFADLGAVFGFTSRKKLNIMPGWGVGGGTRFYCLGVMFTFYYAFPVGFGFLIGSPLDD